MPPIHLLIHPVKWLIEETGKLGGAIGIGGLLLGAVAGWPRKYATDFEASLYHGAHWHNAIDNSITTFGRALVEFGLLAIGGAVVGVAIAFAQREFRGPGQSG